MNATEPEVGGNKETSMLAHPVGRLRAVCLLEGVSFLVLLGVAMPLKYFANLPMAVKAVGWVHGGLFVVLCLMLAVTMRSLNWPIVKGAKVLIAAFVPFGPFVIDSSLRAEQVSSASSPSKKAA